MLTGDLLCLSGIGELPVVGHSVYDGVGEGQEIADAHTATTSIATRILDWETLRGRSEGCLRSTTLRRTMAAASSPALASSAASTASPVYLSGQPITSAASSSAAVLAATSAASTPSTIAITLALPQQPPASLFANGTVLVAAGALLGVLMTLVGAHVRMRSELRAAATESNTEREQTRKQAELDREQTREQAGLDRDQSRNQAGLDWQHEAGEAHRERVATTRRAVYLEAVEELTKAQMFLGGLARQELSKLDYGVGMGGLIAAVNKIAIVGEMDTVAKARKLTSMLTRRLFKGLIQLLPLGGHKASAAFHKAEQVATQLQIQRILAAMTNHNETMKNDPAGFAALQRSFDSHQSRFIAHATGEATANKSIVEQQQAYAGFMVEQMKIVVLHLDELACAIRQELNIKTDFDAFRAQTIEMQSEVDNAMEEMRAAIQKFQQDAAGA